MVNPLPVLPDCADVWLLSNTSSKPLGFVPSHRAPPSHRFLNLLLANPPLAFRAHSTPTPPTPAVALPAPLAHRLVLARRTAAACQHRDGGACADSHGYHGGQQAHAQRRGDGGAGAGVWGGYVICERVEGFGADQVCGVWGKCEGHGAAGVGCWGRGRGRRLGKSRFSGHEECGLSGAAAAWPVPSVVVLVCMPTMSAVLGVAPSLCSPLAPACDVQCGRP